MALTNKKIQANFRERQKELKRSEIRGLYATDSEQKVIKPIVRDKLKELRGE